MARSDHEVFACNGRPSLWVIPMTDLGIAQMAPDDTSRSTVQTENPARWVVPLVLATALCALRCQLTFPFSSDHWLAYHRAVLNGNAPPTLMGLALNAVVFGGWFAITGLGLSVWAHCFTNDDLDSRLIVPWIGSLLALPIFVVSLVPLWVFFNLTWVWLGSSVIAAMYSLIFFVGTCFRGVRPKASAWKGAAERFSYGLILACVLDLFIFWSMGGGR